MEQFVLRRNDVFDFGGRLRLLKRERIDENASIGDRRRAPLQLGQGAVRLGERLEHRNRFEVHRRRQGGNGVGRL